MAEFYDKIARYYDAENQTFVDDLSLYEELADQFGGPILDVGCGTGRVNFHLAQAGYPTVGVDYSAEMLAIAHRKLDTMSHLKDDAKLVEADILTWEATQQFALILLPYNALMHFTELEAQIALLGRLKDMLTPNGALAIDLPNAGEAYAVEDEVGMVLERTFVEPQSGNLVMQQSVSSINRAQQKLYVQWIYDEMDGEGIVRRTLAPLVLRYVFPTEMQLLLRQCGLNMRDQFGDYDFNDFEDGSPRMITVAVRG